jgi:hypothetical protein
MQESEATLLALPIIHLVFGLISANGAIEIIIQGVRKARQLIVF